MKSIRLTLLLGLLAVRMYAQTSYIAYDVPQGTVGNQGILGLGVGNDFCVVQPITISQLGVFTSGTNGIRGSSVLTVQLYERTGRHDGTLLETLTFDAANPGVRLGGSLFKPLPTPVTLLPGNYTIAAYGFDESNPEGNAGRPPYDGSAPLWTTHDGGGLIRFEGVARYGGDVGWYPGHLDRGPANRYAAGNFIFSGATLAAPPYAADYNFLSGGVGSFPIEDTRHLGSLAVLGAGAFPVLVERGGNRIVLEAAGTLNGDPAAARAVAFSHVQWEQPHERVADDGRLRLFENAIQWASRKTNPSDIVMGIATNLNQTFMTNLDLGYFASRGYRIVVVNFETLDLTAGLPPMDVLVVNGHARWVERCVDAIGQFTARGGGLVVSLTPRFVVYQRVRPAFTAVNDILQPFGLAYRSSLAAPADLTFTNIQSAPHPIYFNALAAAELLHADRIRQVRLDSQQKVIALNTITYSVHGQPQLLSELTSIYSGTTNWGVQYPGTAGDFVEVASFTGAQATTNDQTSVDIVGTDLVTRDRRGSVEYTCSVPGGDIYKLQVLCTQDTSYGRGNYFRLVVSLDGQRLEGFDLNSTSSGMVECLTPFVAAGSHTLRISWDNPAGRAGLRLAGVRLQTRLGPDSDSDGIKDWVEETLQRQSGLDLTNEVITSYTSPVCVQGRDPFPAAMSLYVEGADNQVVNLNPRPGAGPRWFANVPLSAFVGADTVLHAQYQNGGLTEIRHLQWLPLNLLSAAGPTIRQNDALLFNAKPVNGPDGNLTITVGTNQLNGRTTQPIVYRFATPGVYSVTGTYIPRQGSQQTRTIQVKVVGHNFPEDPASWVGKQRTWDLPSVSSNVVFDVDSRLLFEPVAALAGDGLRASLLSDENEPRRILSRLGVNGPVLASAKVQAFRLFGAPDTYNRVLAVYPDNSRLVETLIVLAPVLSTLPDVKVRVRVIVGGVTFDDGRTYRELSMSDFDVRGQCRIRFIMPASARTANCHNITVVQGAEVVGAY
jgi:hypothetical protein